MFPKNKSKNMKSQIKIGHGFDVHKLLDKEQFEKTYPGRKSDSVLLGGVAVPHNRCLAGHSDADVLLHAIMDALFGAAALPDIGVHFPPSDDNYTGISSLDLLKICREKISAENFAIGNIDATLICEEPKLKNYILPMREKIAETLEIDLEQINIKATTTEKLGAIGRGEGIAAEAVCLLFSL